jgi:RNA polymerase sigma-70 factor (ECF subfamily)
MRSSSTDNQLIQMAVRGDANAFGDLYERYLRAIYRYVYCWVGDAREAEDLTERVFLKVWESLPGFRVGAVSFRSWLYRAARNLLIDRHRTRKNESSLPEEGVLRESLEVLSPEDRLILRERQERMHAALSALRPEYREVLILRFKNGLSHAEVGEILEKTEGAVRVLQHRALRALMTIMQRMP